MVPKSDNGFKEFTDEDFYWDKLTTPHKKIIIAGVNKVHRENSRCKTIDLSSAYVSRTKDSPSNPVFFVTCSTGSGVFNAEFTKADVEQNATQHPSKARAAELCKKLAKFKATHPNTVEFSAFWTWASRSTRTAARPCAQPLRRRRPRTSSSRSTCVAY